MPANILETLIGWGKRKQADIATANLVAGVWRLGKLNAEFSPPTLNTEDDAEEMGKGTPLSNAELQNVLGCGWTA